jgi:hypothetical protein
MIGDSMDLDQLDYKIWKLEKEIEVISRDLDVLFDRVKALEEVYYE